MKNRAKCKKCGDIIESYHSTDYVMCKCNAIALDGGDGMRCFADDLGDIIRIDDDGNEIIPKIVDKTITICADPVVKPSRADMLDMLSEMIKSYESLPMSAMHAPSTNADMLSALMLISEILRQ